MASSFLLTSALRLPYRPLFPLCGSGLASGGISRYTHLEFSNQVSASR
jgi:hypothetical protein